MKYFFHMFPATFPQNFGHSSSDAFSPRQQPHSQTTDDFTFSKIEFTPYINRWPLNTKVFAHRSCPLPEGTKWKWQEALSARKSHRVRVESGVREYVAMKVGSGMFEPDLHQFSFIHAEHVSCPHARNHLQGESTIILKLFSSECNDDCHRRGS